MTSLTNYVWCLTVIVTLQSVGKLCIEHVYCKSMKDDNLNASYSTFSTHGSGSHCHYKHPRMDLQAELYGGYA